MKKFFCSLLAVCSAFTFLPGCSGGGDSNPTVMSAEDFARGSKYFIFRNGLAGWLYVTPTVSETGYPGVTSGTELVDGVDVSIKTTPPMKGTIGCGAPKQYAAGYDYTCYYDDAGNPVKAKLTISTKDPSNDRTQLINWFNEATPDDGETVQDLRNSPVIVIDFPSRTFEVTAEVANVNPDGPPQNDVETFSGTVVVQRQ